MAFSTIVWPSLVSLTDRKTKIVKFAASQKIMQNGHFFFSQEIKHKLALLVDLEKRDAGSY